MAGEKRWLIVLVAVLIGLRYLVTLPYLTKPIPASYHPGNEAVVTSAALLRYRYGLAALQVVAPLEGRVEARLHSWLTVPPLALGYVEGGRLVSWLASLASLAVLFLVGRRGWGTSVGALGAFLLSMSPTFVLFSYHILPANLSILFTSLAVLLAMSPSSLTRWRGALLLAVFTLGALNHIWEAAILLPLLVLLYKKQARGWIVGLLILGVLVSGVNIFVFGTNYFQVPLGQQHHIRQYSFLHNADLFLSPRWWLPVDRTGSFPNLVASVYFLLALGGMLYAAYRWLRGDGGDRALLLASWLVAGLVPIFLLPRHYVSHDYSVWGTLVPVSLGLAIVADRIVKRLDNRFVVLLLLGGTLLGAGLPIVAERRLQDQPYPLREKLAIREAGLKLSQFLAASDVKPSEITILVEPDRATETARHYFSVRPRLAAFLLYAGVVPVYHNGLQQRVVDNVPPDRFPAPDVVDDPAGVSEQTRLLVGTREALAQGSMGLAWGDRYERWLDLEDVVVLVRR